MYGKLFEQMYNGTLGTKGPWQALVTFQQMIILADSEGVVDMTAEVISKRSTIPLEIIQEGIRCLELPDPDSRTPTEEGRRITRIDPERNWGWHIVNHAHYRKIRSEEERREYMRNYQRARRANVKAVNSASTPVNNVTHAVGSMQNAQEREAPPVDKSSKPKPRKGWYSSAEGIIEAGKLYGLEPKRGETMPSFKSRVEAAAA